MVRYSKHTLVSTWYHLVHPHHRSLPPSTVHNMLALINIAHTHIGGHTLSISAKPGSTTCFPTSTTSAGLQHLLVGAHVHLVWFRAASCRMWQLQRTNVFHASHVWFWRKVAPLEAGTHPHPNGKSLIRYSYGCKMYGTGLLPYFRGFTQFLQSSDEGSDKDMYIVEQMVEQLS